VVENICNEIKELLFKKRQDYGPIDNTIGRFGMTGIVIRLYDKVERLVNLMMNGQKANFESVEDTLMDIAGYSVLGIEQLKKGQHCLTYYSQNNVLAAITIKVTIQVRDYKGWFEYKTCKNYDGLSLISDIIRDLENMQELNSNCDFTIINCEKELWFAAKLKNSYGDILTVEDPLNDLDDYIIKVEKNSLRK